MYRGTQTSNERECLANRCKFLLYYGDTSVRKHTQKQGPFLTPRLLPALTSTQTDSICCVQKRQARKKTGFQGPNSCWIFSPRLGPAARKISQEKSGQSQQKQAADLAESSFTGLGKCGQTKSRLKLYFISAFG